MVKVIVLDGWHAGSVHTMPWGRAEDRLRLIKPRSLTACDCSEDGETVANAETIKEYNLVGMSRDGTTGLYAEGNDLLTAITKGRDWIVNNTARRMPMYFNCSEERAF